MVSAKKASRIQFCIVHGRPVNADALVTVIPVGFWYAKNMHLRAGNVLMHCIHRLLVPSWKLCLTVPSSNSSIWTPVLSTFKRQARPCPRRPLTSWSRNATEPCLALLGNAAKLGWGYVRRELTFSLLLLMTARRRTRLPVTLHLSLHFARNSIFTPTSVPLPLSSPPRSLTSANWICWSSVRTLSVWYENNKDA